MYDSICSYSNGWSQSIPKFMGYCAFLISIKSSNYVVQTSTSHYQERSNVHGLISAQNENIFWCIILCWLSQFWWRSYPLNLNGLNSEYDAFAIFVTTRTEPMKLQDIGSMLLAHENHIDHQCSFNNDTMQVNVSYQKDTNLVSLFLLVSFKSLVSPMSTTIYHPETSMEVVAILHHYNKNANKRQKNSITNCKQRYKL